MRLMRTNLYCTNSVVSDLDGDNENHISNKNDNDEDNNDKQNSHINDNYCN